MRAEPGAGRLAHGAGAGEGRAALGDARTYDHAGSRREPARPGDAQPLPGARPGESERRAPARTPETELYYLAPSRASLLAGHSNSFPTSPAKDFSPPLLSRGPSISTCWGEEEEGGKRKEEKAKAFRADHEYSCNKPTAPTNLP